MPGRGVSLSVVRDAVRGNWRYGRWAGSSSVIYWLSSYAYTPLVGAVVGLSGAGAARAMMNLTMPLNQLVTALGVALLPIMARSAGREGEPPNRNGLVLAVALGGMGVAYLLFMLFAGRWVIDLVYPSGEYAPYYALLIMLCAAQAMAAFRQGLYTGLRATRRPRTIMSGQVVGAVVTLTLGVQLIRARGTTGMGWGQIVSTALEIGVLLVAGWLLIRRRNVTVKRSEVEDAG